MDVTRDRGGLFAERRRDIEEHPRPRVINKTRRPQLYRLQLILPPANAPLNLKPGEILDFGVVGAGALCHERADSQP